MSFLISVIIFMALTFPAISQTPGYYEIIGNKDGTPIQANIGEIIEVPIWGATPVDLDSINGVCYMQDPISSDDNVIAFRYPCDLMVISSIIHSSGAVQYYIIGMTDHFHYRHLIYNIRIIAINYCSDLPG